MFQPDFGIMFDVDGVLARGSAPLEPAKKAMSMLKDANGHLKYPCAFVTNACNRSHDKARQISKWFDVEVRDIFNFCRFFIFLSKYFFRF